MRRSVVSRRPLRFVQAVAAFALAVGATLVAAPNAHAVVANPFITVYAILGTADGTNVDLRVKLWDNAGDPTYTHYVQAPAGETVQVQVGSNPAQTAVTDGNGEAEFLGVAYTPGDIVTATYGAATDTYELDATKLTYPQADIMFLIDESGSMRGVRSALQAAVADLAAAIAAQNVDYQIGIVGNGYWSYYPRMAIPADDEVTSPSDFFTALGNTDGGGGGERNWDGLTMAVDRSTGLRPEAGKCVVPFTDVDPWGLNIATEASTTALYLAESAVVFPVVYLSPPGGSNGVQTMYEPITLATGGTQYELADFLVDPTTRTNLVNALMEDCVEAAVRNMQPDVSVSVSDGVSELLPGATRTYTVSVANATAVANDVEVTLTVTGPQASIGVPNLGGSVSGNTVTWSLGTMNPGDAASLTVPVTVDVSATAGVDVLVGSVSVTTSDTDSDVSNNSATDVTSVVQPDVEVTVTDAVAEVAQGEARSYTVFVANVGVVDVTGVSVVLELTGPQRIDAVGQGGTKVSETKAEWTVLTTPVLGLLPAGGSPVVLTVSVSLTEVAVNGDAVGATARVSEDGASGPELTLANNVAVDGTVVKVPPPLADAGTSPHAFPFAAFAAGFFVLAGWLLVARDRLLFWRR